MANFTAADIKTLREQTGAGMIDVKKALDEADGDHGKAAEILRVKGLKGVTKREGRTASNGLVAAKAENGVGTLVEVLCETDFVAKSEKFIALAEQVLDQAIASRRATPTRCSKSTLADGTHRPGAARRGQRRHRREDRGQAGRPPRGRARRRLPPQDQPRPAGADRCPRGHRRRRRAGRPATSRCTPRRCRPTALTRDEIPAETVENERRIAEATAQARRASPRPPCRASSRVASTGSSRRTC